MKIWNLFILVIIIIDIIIRIIGTGHIKVKINQFSTYFFILVVLRNVSITLVETMTTAL